MRPIRVFLHAQVLIGAVAADSPLSKAHRVAQTQTHPSNGAVFAITPTASGQIGINPVSSELGDPATYDLPKPSTTVPSASTAQVAVETASSDSSDQKKGDVGFVFPQKVADALRKTADGAIQACSLKRDVSKRLDSVQCIIDAAVKASGENGPFDAVMTPEFWEKLGIKIAQNAPEALTSAIAVLSSQAQKNKALLILSAIIAGTKISGGIGAVNVPAAGVGAGVGSGNSNSKCDPSKPLDNDSPICTDADCKGDKDNKCTADANKGCGCVGMAKLMPMQPDDQAWWTQQQQIIGSVAANPSLLVPSAPSCTSKDGGTAFDGKPYVTPAAWCVCGLNGKSSLVPTITGNTKSPCAYTTDPSTTISPKETQSAAPSGSVKITSCRTSTTDATTLGFKTYCTCNDNSMYTIATWTEGGTAKSECEATHTSKPTTSSAPPPKTTASSAPPPQSSVTCPASSGCCKDCPKGYDYATCSGGVLSSKYCTCGDPCGSVSCRVDLTCPPS